MDNAQRLKKQNTSTNTATNQRPPKSAHPRMRGKSTNQLTKPSVVDLTKD